MLFSLISHRFLILFVNLAIEYYIVLKFEVKLKRVRKLQSTLELLIYNVYIYSRIAYISYIHLGYKAYNVYIIFVAKYFLRINQRCKDKIIVL
jgi:hypothetical protein